MKPSLFVVKLTGISILQQLQWEEALLRADQRNWCILNQGSSPAIIMGISGIVDLLVNQEKLKQAPIPLIRRFSGGGTVVVDESTLFVTLIFQADALLIHPFPRPIMEWTADEIYRPLFSKDSFELKENDYVLNQKKWGGNAQSIIKGRWLHHSSLLWDYQSEYMDYLLMPPKTPIYRNRRPHTDFLCRLSDYWSHVNEFQTLIIRQLNRHFTVVEKGREELEKITALPHRKVTTTLLGKQTLPKGTGHCTINTV